ncbi:MAG: hypothetical protein GF313_06020 [Caldithrix sp.]|nr:hypothetical protein [Caldithrix sp.]
MKRIFYLPGWVLFILSLMALCILGYLGWRQAENRYLARQYILEHASEHAEETVCVGYVKIISENRRLITAENSRGDRFQFIRSNISPDIGETWSATGSVNKKGRIHVQQWMHHPMRTSKYVFSALSLVLVLYFIIRYIRFDFNDLVFRDRSLHLSRKLKRK